MSQTKSYLVTGGAGFLGINLIRSLLARGHRVASLDIAPFDYPERDRITALRGDVRDSPTVEAAVRGIDVVVHSAAALPLYKEEDIRSTDIDGTRNVLAAAWRNGAERLIYISTTAVYGVPDHHPITEDDPLQGVGPYGVAKVEAEKLCLDYRRKGFCVTILRPKSFVGPERLGVFSLLYEWAREGHSFPLLGSGRNRYQLLDVEDLCEAIHLAATIDHEHANDTFNIGAAEFTTMREDYQAVLDRAGRGKRIVGLPARPAILVLRLLEALRLSPLYKWVYETADKDSYVSIEKAERVLGFRPRHSNKQALVRNFEWYLENLERFQGQSGVSHRVPWSGKVLNLAKLFF